MRVRVVWSPLALRRAAEAVEFIAQKDRAAAERWARGLFDAVRRLSHFPRKGRVVPEVGREEIREIIYREHRVVYRVSVRLVEVLTMRHGRRRFAREEAIEPE